MKPISVLYDFQKEDVAKIHQLNLNCLLGHQPGLGKTIISLKAIAERPDLRPAVIVCPASLKLGWEDQAMQHLGMRVDVLSGRGPKNNQPPWLVKPSVVVVNYDVLKDWLPWLKQIEPKIVIADECFPANTRVQTEQGETWIGDIVDRKLPVRVASMDFSLNALVYRPVTGYFKVKRRTRLVSIKHTNGTLCCTEEHEIWTVNRGYVKAIGLQPGDYLRMVRGGEDRSEIEETESATVLLDFVRRQMETIAAADQGEDVHEGESRENRSNETRCAEPQSRRLHDCEQPRQAPGGVGKDQSDKRNERHVACLARHQGRERPVDQAADHIDQITPQGQQGLGAGIVHQNQNEEGEWVSDELQSGRRKRSAEDRCGSGRQGPSLESSESQGREEKEVAHVSRVVSVSIHERGSGNGRGGSSEEYSYVYCLEVDGTHNFFADGVLVHNCHYVSSPTAQRTKALRELVSWCDHFIAISATPLTIRPIQLWPVLNMIDPKTWRSRDHFGIGFCGGRRTPWGMDYSRATNTKRLNRLLTESFMIRRLKTDVLKDLPAKTRAVVPFVMDSKEKKEYEEAKENLILWLTKNYGVGVAKRASKVQAMAEVGHLKRLAAKIKLRQAIDWIKDFLDSGEKLLVAVIHKSIVKELVEAFKGRCVKVNGESSEKDRAIAFKRFNKDPKCELFIGNIKAAGVGWSASACSNVAFLEYPWSPGDVVQMEDRTHGIGRGQEGIPTTAHWLTLKGSIEEALVSRLIKSQGNLDSILDGRKVEKFDVFDSVLKSLGRKT